MTLPLKSLAARRRVLQTTFASWDACHPRTPQKDLVVRTLHFPQRAPKVASKARNERTPKGQEKLALSTRMMTVQNVQSYRAIAPVREPHAAPTSQVLLPLAVS